MIHASGLLALLWGRYPLALLLSENRIPFPWLSDGAGTVEQRVLTTFFIALSVPTYLTP